MNNLFNEHSQPVLLVFSKKSEDKYGLKGSLNTLYATQILIKAIVSDIDYARITYKLPGVETSQAKELTIRKQDLESFKSCDKVIINNEEFYGWKDNYGKTQYKDMGDFVSVYIYKRR